MRSTIWAGAGWSWAGRIARVEREGKRRAAVPSRNIRPTRGQTGLSGKLLNKINHRYIFTGPLRAMAASIC
jgi:hypothetical protein